jgi:hypothetical protein
MAKSGRASSNKIRRTATVQLGILESVYTQPRPFDAVEPGGPLRYVVVATTDGGTL